MKEASDQGRINFIEKLEEDQTNPIAGGQEFIAAGMRNLLDEALGPELG